MQFQFPPPNITTLRGTRQKMLHSDFLNALMWTDEYDFDNFVEIWVRNGEMPLFYKLINNFLLILKYDNEEDKQLFNEYIAEILEYGSKFGFTKIIIIEQLLKQIEIQYTTMQLFPVASKSISNETMLYHGCDFLRYPNFSTLQVNSLFEVPIFMSTSLIFDVACGFAGNSKTIIRIIVKASDLNKLKYAFFGNTLDLQSDKSYKENEILLNLYTKLKFKSVTKDVSLTFKVSQPNGRTLNKDGIFTIIDMEFVGNSSKTPEEVMKSLYKQSQFFITSVSGKNKKKYKKYKKSHIKHLSAKIKQSRKIYKKKVLTPGKFTKHYRNKIIN